METGLDVVLSAVDINATNAESWESDLPYGYIYDVNSGVITQWRD